MRLSAALVIAALAACNRFIGPATAGAYEPADCHDGSFCPDPAFPQCPPFAGGKCEAAGPPELPEDPGP